MALNLNDSLLTKWKSGANIPIATKKFVAIKIWTVRERSVEKSQYGGFDGFFLCFSFSCLESQETTSSSFSPR